MLTLLGRLWKIDPENILTTLITYIKTDNEQLQNKISQILVEKYPENPKLIIKNLITIPDESKFITKIR